MQGVGKVVSYTNADRILPRELLDAIQQYADGVYLYIPRKAERKRAWGEDVYKRQFTFPAENISPGTQT